MARTGRKPLGESHIKTLAASRQAKQRLTVILMTLRGDLTIPEASARLGVCESRFHALRRQWLQEAIELLEPRPVGRPPATLSDEQKELDRLRRDQQELQRELRLAEVRHEINEVLGGRSHTVKKTERTAS